MKLKKKVIKKKVIKTSTVQDAFALPTALSTPSDNINDYSILCYGRKKIGKTSLFSRHEKTLFFLFEPGAKSQSIYKVPEKGDCFTNWTEVKGYLKALRTGKHDFETVIFDTGKPAYNMCLKYYCKKAGIEHPGKMKDYGASWSGVTEEFQSAHTSLASVGVGFVVLAHEKYVDFTGADGKVYTRVMPNFSGACNDFYEGIIDIICNYGYIGQDRWLTIRGDDYTVAGCRVENHFLTPKGEKLYKDLQEGSAIMDRFEFEQLSIALGNEQIHRIPMGNSANISNRNLMLAFDNKQTEAFSDLHEEVQAEENKKKKKSKLTIGKKKKKK